MNHLRERSNSSRSSISFRHAVIRVISRPEAPNLRKQVKRKSSVTRPGAGICNPAWEGQKQSAHRKPTHSHKKQTVAIAFRFMAASNLSMVTRSSDYICDVSLLRGFLRVDIVLHAYRFRSRQRRRIREHSQSFAQSRILHSPLTPRLPNPVTAQMRFAARRVANDNNNIEHAFATVTTSDMAAPSRRRYLACLSKPSSLSVCISTGESPGRKNRARLLR